MWQFLKDNPFVVGALSGSLTAYLLGLIVSFIRRDKKWLGYSVDSRNIVSKGHTHLSMWYDTTEINRLDSHTIVIRNIGNRPLTALPIRIGPGTGRIVEHELTPPDGAIFSAAFQESLLIVTCDLLNPGEAASIGVTVADCEDGIIKIVARAENLTVKQIGPQIDTDDLLEAIAGSFWATRLTLDIYRLFAKVRRTR